MAEPLPEKVLAQIDKTEELYHRLILIAAPSGIRGASWWSSARRSWRDEIEIARHDNPWE